MPTIAARLNANPARYPAPAGKAWTTKTVFAVLSNPKYTGHMVYGRRRKRNGHRITVPPEQWLWSPETVHPVIVDRRHPRRPRRRGGLDRALYDAPDPPPSPDQPR
jgi:hypothetical protein